MREVIKNGRVTMYGLACGYTRDVYIKGHHFTISKINNSFVVRNGKSKIVIGHMDTIKEANQIARNCANHLEGK